MLNRGMALYVIPRFWRPPPSAVREDPVVRRVQEILSSSIGAFLDPDRMQALAEDLGCTMRNRKIHAGMVANSLILSAMQHGPDTQGRWLDALAIYGRMSGSDASPSAFGERVRALEPMFRVLLSRRVLALGDGRPELQGRLQRFADVLIPDGCAFKLAATFAEVWPGTGTPAEFKLHTVYSVRSNGLADLRSSAGSVHDNDGFTPTTWVRSALYIWDLGYQDTDRFVDAALSGAVPLQRLKDKINPVVLAWYDSAGKRHELVGEDGRPLRLREACEFSAMPLEGHLDLDVEQCDGQGRKVVARVVCVPFEGADRWYLTTLPRDRFSPADVAEMYRVRWEIERYFRTLRGAVRLDEVRRLRNPVAVRVALLASLVAATLSQELANALNDLEDPLCAEESAAPSTVRPALASCTPTSSEAGFPPQRSRRAGGRVARRLR
jgi:hypothetical protein